jgi:hypothetical protein
VENGSVVVARRDTGTKEFVPLGNFIEVVKQRLADIQAGLLERVFTLPPTFSSNLITHIIFLGYS